MERAGPGIGLPALLAHGLGRRAAAFRGPDVGAGSGQGANRARGRSPNRVLVIDDDAIVAEMYRLALTRAGYEVSIAADGRAGVEAARARRPDFIFLDIRMPGMDGLEVLQALEADAATRGVAVAMLSNYDDGGQVSRSLALGAKEYIVKTSVLPVDLAAVVARWLGAN